MLADPEGFAAVEATLRENGTIERFEEARGKIRGRMMIGDVGLPEWVEPWSGFDGSLTAFEASFDFMDSRVGIAFCVPERRPASDFWCLDEEPDEVWVKLFAETLAGSINPDGSYGVPIDVFISDTSHFWVVPGDPDG